MSQLFVVCLTLNLTTCPIFYVVILTGWHVDFSFKQRGWIKKMNACAIAGRGKLHLRWDHVLRMTCLEAEGKLQTV